MAKSSLIWIDTAIFHDKVFAGSPAGSAGGKFLWGFDENPYGDFPPAGHPRSRSQVVLPDCSRRQPGRYHFTIPNMG